MKKIIITESEKNRILGLHSFDKKIVKESTVKDIQSILVQNKGYNLGQSGVNKDGVDGIVGKLIVSLTAILYILPCPSCSLGGPMVNIP